MGYISNTQKPRVFLFFNIFVWNFWNQCKYGIVLMVDSWGPNSKKKTVFFNLDPIFLNITIQMIPTKLMVIMYNGAIATNGIPQQKLKSPTVMLG